MSDLNTIGAPPAAPVVDEPVSTSDNRKKFLILGGALVLVLALIGGFLLMSGGGGEEDLGPVPSASNKAAQAEAPSPAEAEAAAQPAPEEYTDNLGRDPFEPVYPPAEQAAPADEAPAASATSTLTAPGVTTGTAVSLTLVDVTGGTATFSIDGATVTAPSDGSSFGSNFRLYGTFDERCAGVLAGDQSFVMCEGDSRQVTA